MTDSRSSCSHVSCSRPDEQMARPHEEHELPRVLNASHATSFVVGIIIGSGIFLVPREMMAAVGSSVAVYAVWIVGGVLSLFRAMPYAETAASRVVHGAEEGEHAADDPHRIDGDRRADGGEYAFLREAY